MHVPIHHLMTVFLSLVVIAPSPTWGHCPRGPQGEGPGSHRSLPLTQCVCVKTPHLMLAMGSSPWSPGQPQLPPSKAALTCVFSVRHVTALRSAAGTRPSATSKSLTTARTWANCREQDTESHCCHTPNVTSFSRALVLRITSLQRKGQTLNIQ